MRSRWVLARGWLRFAPITYLLLALTASVAQAQEPRAAFSQKRRDTGVFTDCDKLGTLHQDGDGVLKDVSRAVALYRKACDAGNLGVCVYLGDMYRDGFGVPRDATRAAALYRRACDGGNPEGCCRLR